MVIKRFSLRNFEKASRPSLNFFKRRRWIKTGILRSGYGARVCFDVSEENIHALVVTVKRFDDTRYKCVVCGCQKLHMSYRNAGTPV